LVGTFLGPVADELRAIRKQKKNRVLSIPAPDAPVFDSSNHRAEWSKACAKADEENRTRTGVRIHDCRCSGAINLLASGVDEGLVLKIGGWKTRSMLDRYNLADITRLSAAMEKGGKFVTDRIAVAGTTR
jgi:hypothetical protein